MAVPGKGARIAGVDYHYGGNDGDQDDYLCDTDLGPGGLVVENSKGGAGQNDEESRIRG